MSTYQVFKHPEKGFKAVKDGFSWPGFFFTWLWSLSRRLWLVSVGLIFVAVGLGIFFAQIGPQNPYLPAALSLIFAAFVGIFGNSWCVTHLYDYGYAVIGRINARSPQDAAAKVAASGGVIPAELRAARRPPGFFAVPRYLQGLFAIITLTWKAAFRYKLFWVIAALLLAAVIGLPILVKDDGTAAGFAQILITYTLGAVTGLLGFCTLWLACGTLARDVEECQMQMVAVKPIGRWQIWLGKWLGIVTLNAALLAVAGTSIYGLLEWRARRLAPEELAKLRNEVLVARGSAKEQNLDAMIEKQADIQLKERMDKHQLGDADPNNVRAQLQQQLKLELQAVPPGGTRWWVINLGAAKDHLKDQPLFLRTKFHTALTTQPDTVYAAWQVGTPKKTPIWQDEMSLAPDTFHEFPVGPNLFDDKGNLIIGFRNMNDMVMLFALDEGMEVLYRQGGFGLNLIRGLGIILCWMALLAALGLAAASFLSFPVAAFFSLALLAISLSSGTLSNVVTDGTIMGFNEEKGTRGHSALDNVAVPVFRVMLDVINLVQQFSPIDSLTTGRSVTWEELGRAVGQIVLLLGGLLALIGIFIFQRRELATAQGTQ